MKKNVKKYVRESMPNSINVNNEFTIKNSKIKNRKFNIATSNQSQSQNNIKIQTQKHSSSINHKRDEQYISKFSSNKKSRTENCDNDNKFKFSKKTNIFLQVKHLLIESNHIMNTKKKSNQKQFIKKNNQKNDENNSIEISNLFLIEFSCL